MTKLPTGLGDQKWDADFSSLPEFPTNLLEFQRMFPDETACLRYLQQLRWPGGFVCESCGVLGEPFRLATRPRVVKCRACERETSVTEIGRASCRERV